MRIAYALAAVPALAVLSAAIALALGTGSSASSAPTLVPGTDLGHARRSLMSMIPVSTPTDVAVERLTSQGLSCAVSEPPLANLTWPVVQCSTKPSLSGGDSLDRRGRPERRRRGHRCRRPRVFVTRRHHRSRPGTGWLRPVRQAIARPRGGAAQIRKCACRRPVGQGGIGIQATSIMPTAALLDRCRGPRAAIRAGTWRRAPGGGQIDLTMRAPPTA